VKARARAAALLVTLGAAAPLLAGCGAPPTPPAPLPTPALPTPSDVQLPQPPFRPASGMCPVSLRPQRQLPRPDALPPGPVRDIQLRGQLRVGVGTGGNRLSYRDPLTGQMSGFEVEIARRIAKAIFGDDRPDRVVFITVNAKNRADVLKSRSVDILLAAITTACDRIRDDSAAFSAPYYMGIERLLVPRDSSAETITDLAGQRICASSNSTNIRHIATWPAHPRLIPVAAQNTADCMVMLQQHQVAGILTGDMILAGLLAQDPTTKLLARSDDDILAPTGVEMPAGQDDLVRFVNGVLEQIRLDGTWVELQERWLAPYIGKANPPIPTYTD
jgi:polar amino acid transport system substrate-binding protein